MPADDARSVQRLRWEGDRNGQLVLSVEGSEERQLDRLGDLLVAMSDGRVPESLLGVAGAFGVCLSTRSVDRPIFVRQIVDRAIRHVAGCAPVSVSLYQTMERLRRLMEVPLEGAELRDRILEEACSIQREAEA